MAEYVVLIVGDPDRGRPHGRRPAPAGYAEYTRFGEELNQRGHTITGGAELHATSEGKRIPPVAARHRRAVRRGHRAGRRLLPGATPTTSTTSSTAARSSRRSATRSRCAARCRRRTAREPSPRAAARARGRVGAAAHRRSTRRGCGRTSSSTATSPPAVTARRGRPADPVGRGRVDAAGRSGGVLVTDGPFTESVEQVVGFYLVETADRADLVRVCGEFAGRGELIELRDMAERRRTTTRPARAP